jgi:hypothetical protein
MLFGPMHSGSEVRRTRLELLSLLAVAIDVAVRGTLFVKEISTTAMAWFLLEAASC